MNCEQFDKLIPEYLYGEVQQPELTQFNEHLENCSSCKAELDSLRDVWVKVGTLPNDQPSESLQTGFNQMLDAYSEGALNKPHTRSGTVLLSFLPKRPIMQIAAALILFAAGALSGSRIFTGPEVYLTEIKQMRTEMHQMNRLVALTLIDQSSASKRLQGIRMISQMEDTDNAITDILLDLILNDPNVNVRMASASVLRDLSRFNMITTRLISALFNQTSPLVQISMVDLLVSIGDKKAASVFHEMLQKDDLDKSVRERLELAIAQLASQTA